MRLLPDFSNWGLTLSVLIIPLTIQWWSVWYPGAEPGGGSYIAQRMLAAKDEKNAMAATLWFNIAHYALRPWPWIIVALCSILVFPSLADIQTALPHVSDDLIGNDLAYPAMLTLLPAGLLGLLVASLLSAYVSTMSTHLNWGCSYLVHDLYRRFLKPDASERHLVWLSRVVTAVLMVVSGATVFLLSTAGEAFHLLLSIGAGTGLIYLLRWFWWRINAWSEIAAMAASFTIALALLVARKSGLDLSSHAALVWSVALTTVRLGGGDLPHQTGRHRNATSLLPQSSARGSWLGESGGVGGGGWSAGQFVTGLSGLGLRLHLRLLQPFWDRGSALRPPPAGRGLFDRHPRRWSRTGLGGAEDLEGERLIFHPYRRWNER